MALTQSPEVSIVVPTYREAESLPALIERLAQLRKREGLDLEVLIVDDNSRDGTEQVMADLAEPWLQLVVRTSDRGLSQAVLHGLGRARGQFLVVMDADLSHPPETIPSMLAELRSGSDFVVGSRYVAGGTTAEDWGVLRYLNSRVATLLARPLTHITDPMSGFFALPRVVFERARDPSPLGYKIGLELLVRCGCRNVREVPIHFSNRTHGESKLTLNQQLLYLRHLGRLYRYKLRELRS